MSLVTREPFPSHLVLLSENRAGGFKMKANLVVNVFEARHVHDIYFSILYK